VDKFAHFLVGQQRITSVILPFQFFFSKQHVYLVMAWSADPQDFFDHGLAIESLSCALAAVAGSWDQVVPREQHTIAPAKLTHPRFLISARFLQSGAPLLADTYYIHSPKTLRFNG
jgi:hypothetical protein